VRLHRIWAVIVRHVYEARRSPDRVADTLFWPLIDVLVWGFMTIYLRGHGGAGLGVFAFLLAAAMLWGLFRNFQRDMALGFLNEVWARSLIGLFATPLTVGEYLVALIAINLVKAAAALGIAALVAWGFYAYNIFPALPLLLPYLAILVLFALAVGLMLTGLILRYTTRIQSLTWTVTGILMPFSCVFYPLHALPAAIRPVAALLPTTQAFEGMRHVLAQGTLAPGLIATGMLTDLAALVIAAVVFATLFRSALGRGLLVKLG
jgi:ABC-2 type transport system permease protein